ncbi:WAT1-related protein [Tripterygium wilfordii]|uniref:WAT1-related protein n=1 Tax=Tripterygium wilfordii TaxID=458696 RepID=A0A7J7DUB4_TRIWF|nr:WAT1-related protein [Tripterygium wilfordii]
MVVSTKQKISEAAKMACNSLCTFSVSASSSLRRHFVPLSPPLNTISLSSFSRLTPNPQSSSPSSTCSCFRNRRNVNPCVFCISFKPTTIRPYKYVRSRFNCRSSGTEMESEADVGVGTGLDVECTVSTDSMLPSGDDGKEEVMDLRELGVLVSPFFFWGTAMVAMKEVLPRTGPFFVSSFRLIPAGLLLVAFAAYKDRPMPSGLTAWLSIALFALVDATCFQGFLAQGLQRTSAGLGSVIIDSQPLTVAVLAALLFGESIGFLGAAGLILGVVGILLLEVPALSIDESKFSLWGSGEWWMLLAAQSMAVGTVMVRWVSKYSDPVMATGWVRCPNSQHCSNPVIFFSMICTWLLVASLSR